MKRVVIAEKIWWRTDDDSKLDKDSSSGENFYGRRPGGEAVVLEFLRGLE